MKSNCRDYSIRTRCSNLRLRQISGALLTALVLFFFLVRARGQSCPLTEAQARNAIDAFAPIANFLTHEPRCANCHGGVNAMIHGTGLDPNNPLAPPSQVVHGGGFVRRQNDKAPDGTALIESECQDCHNTMVPRRDGSPSVWFDAPPFLSFVNKDATTLCRQIKGATHTAEKLMNHLEDDEGGNNFAKTAFAGTRGLDPDRFDEIVPVKPSMTQAQVKQLARKWIDAMGGKFQGDVNCGCELRHSKWSGQMRYAYSAKRDELHTELQDSSGYTYVTTTITVKNGVGTWQSHYEEKADSANRQKVFPSGYKKDGSQHSDGSADGSIPMTFDIWIGDNNTYKMNWELKSTSVVFGKDRWVGCIGDPERCTTQERDLGMTDLGHFGFEGKLTDRNHIQGSDSHRLDNASSHAVILETISWDFWRNP